MIMGTMFHIIYFYILLCICEQYLNKADTYSNARAGICIGDLYTVLRNRSAHVHPMTR